MMVAYVAYVSMGLTATDDEMHMLISSTQRRRVVSMQARTLVQQCLGIAASLVV